MYKLYLVKLIPDRKEETVTNAIIELLKDLLRGAVKTITCDRGKEFAGWKRIEDVLIIKHIMNYLMSIYVNVALDLTNYHV